MQNRVLQYQKSFIRIVPAVASPSTDDSSQDVAA
jgi:hypothetical protein